MFVLPNRKVIQIKEVLLVIAHLLDQTPSLNSFRRFMGEVEVFLSLPGLNDFS